MEHARSLDRRPSSGIEFQLHMPAPFSAIRGRVRRRRDDRKRSNDFAVMRRDHRSRRLAEIQAALAEAEFGFVFIAGDSHAELLGSPRLGRPVVNGGIGAQRVIEIARALPGLRFQTRALASFVIIGQNDTFLVNGPLTLYRRFRLWFALRGIILLLKKRSDFVIFSAIPPYCEDIVGNSNLDLFRRFSKYITSLCSRHGCLLIDGFEDVRSENFDLVRSATPMDASKVHLADYGQVGQKLRSVIDAIIAGDPDPIRLTAGSDRRATVL